MEKMRQAKEPTSALLAGPYGHPYHPILVTVPIGAWVTGSVFDIGSHVVGDPDPLVQGATWLIAVGVIGALGAAMVGFLDFFAIPSGTRVHRTALLHLSLMLAVTVAFALDFWWRTASDVAPGHAVPAGPLALSLCALAVLAVGGAVGGKLAYRYGVRVADEATQADGYQG